MNEEVFWKGCLGYWIRDIFSGDKPLIPSNYWQQISDVENNCELDIVRSRTRQLQYNDLSAGLVLNLVYFYADPDSFDTNLLDANDGIVDSQTRLKYFKILFNNLCDFYKNRLGRVIVMTLPNLLNIARNPSAEQSGHDMIKILILLLKCITESDRGEIFKNRIATMALDIQNELNKICEQEGVTVLALNGGEETSIVQKIAEERNDLQKKFMDLMHELDSDTASSTNAFTIDDCGSSTTSSKTSTDSMDNDPTFSNETERKLKHEITKLTGQYQLLAQELESKEEENIEINLCRQKLTLEYNVLKSKTEEFVSRANKYKDLEDDYEIMKSKCVRMPELEKSNERLRKQLSDYEVIQNRKNELEKENVLLNDSIKILQDKDEKTSQKMTNSNILSDRLKRAEESNKMLESELAKVNLKHQDVLLNNTKMQRTFDDLNDTYNELRRKVECNSLDHHNDANSSSLAFQLDDCLRTENIRLQHENLSLTSKLNSTLDAHNNSIMESEDVEDLRNSIEKLKQQLKSKESALVSAEKDLEKERECNGLNEKQVVQLSADKNALSATLKETNRQLNQIQNEIKYESDIIAENERKDFRRQLSEKEHTINEILEEKSKIDSVLCKIQFEKKNQRIELEDCKQTIDSMALENSSLSREKKTLEKERVYMKERLEATEEKAHQFTAKVIELENLNRRLKNMEQTFSEKCIQLIDVEAKNDSLESQNLCYNISVKKLRTELDLEKGNIGDLICRLRSVITAMKLNGERFLGTEMMSYLDDVSKTEDAGLVKAIDTVFMKSFDAARNEADALRVQQQDQIEELDSLKKDIEALRKAGSEIPGMDDEKKKLMKENCQARDQISSLQNKLAQMDAIERNHKDNARIVKDIEKEKTHLSLKLENISCLNETLNGDVQDLKNQINHIVAEKCEISKILSEKESNHHNLVQDYDSLYDIHQKLVHNYELKRSENVNLKNQIKNDNEFIELKSICELNEKENRSLKEELFEERSINAQTLRQLTGQQNENNKLKKDLSEIKVHYERLRADQDRVMRSEPLMLTMNASLGKQIEQLNELLSRRDQEIAELREELKKIRNLFENERLSLHSMVDNLQKENRELVKKSMSDKDSHYNTNKELHKKLEDQRRIQEKLEEKVMDQFKALGNKPLQKEKNSLVSKTMRAFTGRSPSRKGLSKTSLIHGSSSDDGSNSSEEATLTPPAMTAKLIQNTNGQSSLNQISSNPQNLSGLSTPTFDQNSSDGSGGNDSGIYFTPSHAHPTYSDCSYSSASSTTSNNHFNNGSSHNSPTPLARNVNSDDKVMHETKLSSFTPYKHETVKHPNVQKLQRSLSNLLDVTLVGSKHPQTTKDDALISRKIFERATLRTRSLRLVKSPEERTPSPKPSAKSSMLANGAKGLACCLIPSSRRAIKESADEYKVVGADLALMPPVSPCYKNNHDKTPHLGNVRSSRAPIKSNSNRPHRPSSLYENA